MWTLKIINANNECTVIHYDNQCDVTDEYCSLTEGLLNNDDKNIKLIKVESIEFPSDPKYLN